MKVNPIGIQAYQQLNRQEKPTELKQNRVDNTETEKILIEPKAAVEKSSLSVKGPTGNYAQFLTNDERVALESLFDKFCDSARFGSGYRGNDNITDESKLVGNVLDVKV